MKTSGASSFVRLVGLAFALVIWVSACHKWVELEPPYGPAIEAAQTDELRVTTDGQRTVYKSSLTVKGDTLWAGATSIYLEGVESVEARKADLAGTLAIVLPVTAVVIGEIVYVVQGTP
jgi:hypothetical protein